MTKQEEIELSKLQIELNVDIRELDKVKDNFESQLLRVKTKLNRTCQIQKLTLPYPYLNEN